MFKHLTDFSYKRNWKEAIGFYLAYLFLVFVGAFLYGIAEFSFTGTHDTFSQGFSEGFNQGAGMAGIVATVFSLTISTILLKEKKLYKNFGYILLTLVGAFVAAFGGPLLGFIVPTFISTRSNLQ